MRPGAERARPTPTEALGATPRVTHNGPRAAVSAKSRSSIEGVMTCVAYKDGIMACDTACTENDVVLTHMTKIFRLPGGAILGEAGEADSRSVRELLKNVKTPRNLPTRKELLDLQIDYAGLLVLPKGRIFYLYIDEPHKDSSNWSGGLFEVGESFFAIGSGRAYALAAMECGKSARDAVYAAIRREIHCRAPVHTMPLIPPEPRPKRRKKK